MPRILGVDPGSRLAGYGIIDLIGSNVRHVAHGTLRLGRSEALSPRLHALHAHLAELIQEYRPTVLVVERVFFGKNVHSLIQLGQARGVVLLAGEQAGLKLFEYAPTEVKQAVGGSGRAGKEQVSRMVQLLVGEQKLETLDASDALALAICHAHLAGGRSSASPKRSSRSLSDALAHCWK
jgi:crossover junction endodeoxyribonuclease RuvC